MRQKLYHILFLLLPLGAMAQNAPNNVNTTGKLVTWPVMHASFVMTYQAQTVYVDPAGDIGLYKTFAAPDLILITDIHGDHLDGKVLEAINKKNAIIVAPKAVVEKLPASAKGKVVILNNGEKTTQLGIEIIAIPMYNLPETSDSRHPKGRGNGYVVKIGGQNVYISGDTEDIPEMRALKNIDVAFVCMNLPYTMDINQAASAVLEFKPGIVYPYHYRGQDIKAFKKLVTDKNKRIEVRLRDWYPLGQ